MIGSLKILKDLYKVFYLTDCFEIEESVVHLIINYKELSY